MLKIIYSDLVLALCFLAITGVLPAGAAKYTIPLTSANVSVKSPSNTTLGDYYTVNFDIPDVVKGKELYGAYLELYLDVDAVEQAGQINETPRLEVYALKSSFTGEINTEQFGTPAFGPGNALLGENKRILIDISEIIRSYLEHPSKNFGLILGSFSGIRDGIFRIKNNVLGNDVLAKVIFHYRSSE